MEKKKLITKMCGHLKKITFLQNTFLAHYTSVRELISDLLQLIFGITQQEIDEKV